MQSSHCTVLAPIFTHRLVLWDRRQMPEIRGKPVLIQVTITRMNYKRRDWENHRCVADACEIFGMIISGLVGDSKSCCVKSVLTDNYIGDDLQPMRAQDTGQRKVLGGVIWNIVCGPDRVISDSFYYKVMQCVTSCRRSIVQCEHRSNWMLPQTVVQCENKWSEDFENHAV